MCEEKGSEGNITQISLQNENTDSDFDGLKDTQHLPLNLSSKLIRTGGI